MSETAMPTTVQTSASVAVPVGRNGWVRKEVTLHHEAGRLIKVEGIELAQNGPMGLTGTMYVVKESLRYDSRMVMRIERQKIVNGKIVDMRNWGEIEDTVKSVAPAKEPETATQLIA
jgi:hypothetical protein